jgi:putative hydrolase of the HAD superfamily
MGLWKPDYKIYDAVINKIDLSPQEILFVDDNQDNVDAAADMGIQCIKINPPECFTDTLQHIL